MQEQSVEILIDYLTITKPKLSLGIENEIAALLHDYDGYEKWEATTPPKGYRVAVKNEIGALGASGRVEQGTLLSWSGSALKRTDAVLIAETALSNDWRITRLDCTVDFLGFDTQVEDFLQEYKNGQVNTTAKTHDNHTSENDGHTVYIGSWNSSRYLRIYNKRASEARFTDVSGLPEKWTRCELVLREEHARHAVRVISDRGYREAIPALLRGYADFVNIQEYREMASIPVTTKGKGKVESNRQKWLLEQVLPTLMEEISRDKEFEQKFMGQLMAWLGY